MKSYIRLIIIFCLAFFILGINIDLEIFNSLKDKYFKNNNSLESSDNFKRVLINKDNLNPSFSLDATILEYDEDVFKDITLNEPSIQNNLIYILEYRGFPNYRILEFDLLSKNLKELVKIPKGSLVYSMSISKDKKDLILIYSDNLEGTSNGIYSLSIEDIKKSTNLKVNSLENLSDFDHTSYLNSFIKILNPIKDASKHVFYKDLNVDENNNIWVSKIEEDLSANLTKSSIEKIDQKGNILISISNVINPISYKNFIYYLPLEKDLSRNSIASLNINTNETENYSILDNNYDLDDFLINDSGLYISVLNRNKKAYLPNFFSKVSAHGNHSIPSIWVNYSLDGNYISDLDLNAEIVYDATFLNESIFSSKNSLNILEITNEGLTYINSTLEENNKINRLHLIKSRAFRFIAN